MTVGQFHERFIARLSKNFGFQFQRTCIQRVFSSLCVLFSFFCKEKKEKSKCIKVKKKREIKTEIRLEHGYADKSF